MKPTTSSSKWYSSACVSRAGTRSNAASVHTPRRHQLFVSLACLAPQLNANGNHRGYVETPPAPAAHAAFPVTPGLRRVLHIDTDRAGAVVLAALLAPEAQLTHAATVAAARHLLEANVFALVVLDPAMADGDVRSLLPLLAGTPLLVYSALQPEWRDVQATFLPKPWTSARQLWVTISSLLGVPASLAAGD
ncbi:MAG: hypothetical protein V4484_11710 [Pseudomonadota bacterium]